MLVIGHHIGVEAIFSHLELLVAYCSFIRIQLLNANFFLFYSAQQVLNGLLREVIPTLL